MDPIEAVFSVLCARPLDIFSGTSREGSSAFADRVWARMGPRPTKHIGDWDCSLCRSSAGSQFSFASERIAAHVLRDVDKEALPDIRYPPLSTDSAIRLLNIKPTADTQDIVTCTFQELDLRNEPGYAGFSVLSYTWGTEDAVYPINVNGQRYYVPRNLWEFLIQARHNGWTARIWVDALCINQVDFQERASQVPRMGEIYSRASQVLVWLGTLSHDERVALRELDLIQDEVQWRNWSNLDYDEVGKNLSDSAKQGIRTLIRHPYWERKWIIQELQLSHGTASVVVGGTTIPIYRLRGCFVTAYMFLRSDLYFRSDVKRLNLLLPSQYSNFKASSFQSVVTKYKDNLCGEPRDHVYALLGLSNTTDFRVDYKEPLVNLYWRTMEKAFSDHTTQRADDITCLCAVLQEVLALSKGEVKKRWAEIVAKGEDTVLSGYQFMEATQLALADLCAASLPTEFQLPEVLANLPSIDLDYKKFAIDIDDSKDDDFSLAFAQLALNLAKKMEVPQDDTTDTNAEGPKAEEPAPAQKWFLNTSSQKEELMALFRIVKAHHPSNFDTQGDLVRNGQFGDYLVCTVDDVRRPAGVLYLKQAIEYVLGAKFLRFPAAEESSPFGYSVQGAAKIWRMSKMDEMTMHTVRGEQQDTFLRLQKGDVVCAFSGHQAALVIRRLSKDMAVCGSAAMSFGDGGQRIYMQPHSLLRIRNWAADVGKPSFRFKERCSCKPGQGGCK